LIRDKLRDGQRIAFRDLFDPPYYKARLIGLFLAVLELIKMHEIDLEQAEPFGEIWVTRAAGLRVLPTLQA
jgi:segregation and condensation protein A